jgi:rubrerythrin
VNTKEVKVMDPEWECMDCGYLFEGRQPPRRCPDCGAVGAWEKLEYIDDSDDDDPEEEEEEVTKMDPEWECMDCGYLHEGKQPPRRCPDCGAVGAWERVEYIDEWDDDDDGPDEE